MEPVTRSQAISPNFLSQVGTAGRPIRRVLEQAAACAKVRGRGSGLAPDDWRGRTPGAGQRHPAGRSGANGAPLFSRWAPGLCAALTLIVLGSAPARAAGETWQVDDVQGAALVLVDGQWHEIRPGDRVRDGDPVRTLQTGSVELTHGGIVIRLDRQTAVELDVLGVSRATVVQYAGTVSTEVADRARVVLRAGDLVTRVEEGQVTVRMDHGAASVSVGSGRARVSDRSGHTVTLGAHQTASEKPAGGASGVGPAKQVGPAVPAIPAEPGGPGARATPATPATPAHGQNGGGDAGGPGNGGNGNTNGGGNGNNGNGGNGNGNNGNGRGNH